MIFQTLSDEEKKELEAQNDRQTDETSSNTSGVSSEGTNSEVRLMKMVTCYPSDMMWDVNTGKARKDENDTDSDF